MPMATTRKPAMDQAYWSRVRKALTYMVSTEKPKIAASNSQGSSARKPTTTRVSAAPAMVPAIRSTALERDAPTLL